MGSYVIRTPHYIFTIHCREDSHLRMMYFHVGQLEKPCLKFSVMQPDVHDFLKDQRHIVHLENVEAFEECIENEINEEYMGKYSFGYELINAMIDLLKREYPYVTTIKLADKSYIPCRKSWAETLDLLTYSIAIYGKTWYERKFSAVFEPKTKYEKYREQIRHYTSTEFKTTTPFTTLFKYIVMMNKYTADICVAHYAEYESLYETSATYPIFFRRLSDTIDRQNKCKFFKSWLESFIHDIISDIGRSWIFNIYTASKEGGKYTRKRTRRTASV